MGSEKVGGVGWASSRLGWLLELLTDLEILYIGFEYEAIEH